MRSAEPLNFGLKIILKINRKNIQHTNTPTALPLFWIELQQLNLPFFSSASGRRLTNDLKPERSLNLFTDLFSEILICSVCYLAF